ncbi:hypothetical protein KVG96_14575 [Pseudomonas sp. COR58]|uniref:Uncharacterized protein n=1 Tax=Pseudomonas ekonensis TaxID=2842353 RepID=A0ABS6PGM8_9PSED|nr:hypothetical protein [Pseudomonas ekonensis]MBV4459182.1 hypothetical protein [Pseudomonas ekonensis]
MATIEQRIYDGNRARECLENEQFNRAFDGIERELTEAWQTSPARDVEGREKIYLSLQLLRKLKAALQSSLETGKLAEVERIHKKSALDRVREILPL